jgi:hypothetical protein
MDVPTVWTGLTSSCAVQIVFATTPTRRMMKDRMMSELVCPFSLKGEENLLTICFCFSNSVFCTYKTQDPTNPRERPTREAPPPRVESSCDGWCPGSFPYGCADSLEGVVKYMCLPGGGCYYARDAEDEGPYNE